MRRVARVTCNVRARVGNVSEYLKSGTFPSTHTPLLQARVRCTACMSNTDAAQGHPLHDVDYADAQARHTSQLLLASIDRALPLRWALVQPPHRAAPPDPLEAHIVGEFATLDNRIGKRFSYHYSEAYKAGNTAKMESMVECAAEPSRKFFEIFNKYLDGARDTGPTRSNSVLSEQIYAFNYWLDQPSAFADDTGHSIRQSALFSAAMRGQEALVQILVKYNADSRGYGTLDPSGPEITVLSACAVSGRLKMARAILGHGSDVNARNPIGGETALHCAVRAGDLDMVVLLLSYRANVDLRTVEGNSALHVAARVNQSGACAQVLLDSGANIEAQDGDKKTPLATAIASSNTWLVIKLLANGANVLACPKGADEGASLTAFTQVGAPATTSGLASGQHAPLQAGAVHQLSAQVALLDLAAPAADAGALPGGAQVHNVDSAEEDVLGGHLDIQRVIADVASSVRAELQRQAIQRADEPIPALYAQLRTHSRLFHVSDRDLQHVCPPWTPADRSAAIRVFTKASMRDFSPYEYMVQQREGAREESVSQDKENERGEE